MAYTISGDVITQTGTDADLSTLDTNVFELSTIPCDISASPAYEIQTRIGTMTEHIIHSLSAESGITLNLAWRMLQRTARTLGSVLAKRNFSIRSAIKMRGVAVPVSFCTNKST